jgi:multiple sugar transport system substrate-binding protein
MIHTTSAPVRNASTVNGGIAAPLERATRRAWTRRIGCRVAGASGILAAACGGGQRSPADSAPAAQPGTVAWMAETSPPARWGAYERTRDAFAQANPSIKIELLGVDDPIGTLKTVVAGGQPPDIAGITPIWTPGMVEKGFYQTVDPYVSKDKAFKLDDYVPATIEAGRWKTKLYFLPQFSNFHVLAYNTAMLTQRGVGLPTEQWTWETLKEAAGKLTQRSGTQTDVFGFTFSNDLNNLLPWIWSNGGDAFDRNEAPTRSTLTNPKTVQALQFLADLKQVQHVAPTAADRAGRTLAFTNGTIAMQMQGVSGISSTVDQAKFDWNIQLVPKGAAGRVNFGGMIQTGLVRDAKSPQHGWTLLKFLHGLAGNRELIKANQGMTPYKPSFPEYLRLGAPPANRQAVIDAQATVRPLPKAIMLETQYASYTAAFDAMMEGKKSVLETCQELDRIMTAALAA